MNEFVETEYKNKLKNFITQLELSFDYIKEDVISGTKKYIAEKTLKEICNDITNQISKYSDVIDRICKTNKVKTVEYEFLNNIKMFNKLLDFSIFGNENKNTKKSIVENLKIILNETYVLNLLVSKKDVSDDDINDLIENMQNLNNTNISNNNVFSELPDISNIMSGNFTNIVDDLMKDDTISGLVKDISNEFESGNINPSDLMNIITNPESIKQNSALQSVINNITSKVDESVKNGKLNPSKLEEQAKSLLSKIAM